MGLNPPLAIISIIIIIPPQKKDKYPEDPRGGGGSRPLSPGPSHPQPFGLRPQRIEASLKEGRKEGREERKEGRELEIKGKEGEGRKGKGRRNILDLEYFCFV